MTANLHIVVLAAGGSARLGQPKQLVHLGGRPALHLVLTTASLIAGHAVTVVVGAHVRELTHLLSHSTASVVVNRHWEEGLASSLRCGINSLPGTCEAALVLLGDQVMVTTDDLKRLVSAWQSSRESVAAAVYERHVGVPAIFPRYCFADLIALRGDHGARAIIERNRDRLVRMPMPSAAIDLDTPEQLAALTERFATGEHA
jgi:molybdenum cofactor cytidylyltransferase